MKIREILNLTSNEEKVYTVLLEFPHASTLDIAKIAELPRTRVYELLSKLTNKNLLKKTSEGYRVLPPTQAVDLIKDQIELETRNRMNALSEIGQQLETIWRNGVVDTVTPDVEILSFVDIEAAYLRQLQDVSKRVFIAAASSSGGINWSKSGQTLAKSYSPDLDIRYLYADSVMASKMIQAFKHYVPFKTLEIKIRSNPNLQSSFILLDSALYIFFMGADSIETKVLHVRSSDLLATFKWIFEKLWDDAL